MQPFHQIGQLALHVELHCLINTLDIGDHASGSNGRTTAIGHERGCNNTIVPCLEQYDDQFLGFLTVPELLFEKKGLIPELQLKSFYFSPLLGRLLTYFTPTNSSDYIAYRGKVYDVSFSYQ